jgi:hypothetical protein
MNDAENIRKNILATIIYYDILNFPLTSFEVWKYMIVEAKLPSGKFSFHCPLGEIVEALDSDELKNNIEEFRGFYFLRGRKDLVGRRIQNDKNSIVKFEIAEKTARWLKYIPFVRMIAVTGTLAMKNCEKDSDIDFFVVLGKERIFTGRLFATAMVHLLRKRRYGEKIKNRICLNYFITTGSLEIERQDLFAANEYSFIYPLFGLDVFQKFCETNLDWIKKFKPNWELPELKPARYFVESSKFSSSVQKAGESLINLFWGDRIESWLKKKQIARIKRNPLTQKLGAYIEYSDKNLIFLPEPQGVRIEEEWRRRPKILTAK